MSANQAKQADSIWHELAERALDHRYLHFSITVLSDLSRANADTEKKFWNSPDFDVHVAEFYCATPEEQCLFLLFIGEMYDSSSV